MKKMMKVVTGKIESYTTKKHEMEVLQDQIIKEMNEMEAFYRDNKYSDNKPKPHLEDEVINSYNANKKRIERAGINTNTLKPLMRNSTRKYNEDRLKIEEELRRNPASPHDEDRMPVNYHTAEPRKSRNDSEDYSSSGLPVPQKRAEEKSDWDDEEYEEFHRERGKQNDEFGSRYEYCV